MEIVSVSATEMVDLRRQPSSFDAETAQVHVSNEVLREVTSSVDVSTVRRFAGTGVDDALPGSRDHDAELRARAADGHEGDVGHVEIGHEARSGHADGRLRAVFADRIDVTFKVWRPVSGLFAPVYTYVCLTRFGFWVQVSLVTSSRR